MSLCFENRVALVTGAGSGMGLATAKAFAEAGASVVLADRPEESVRAAVLQIVEAGHQALAVRCDVSDESQAAAMVDQTMSAFGRLDAAFNNAGVQSPVAETADASGEEFDRVNAINLRGIWNCMKYKPHIGGAPFVLADNPKLAEHRSKASDVAPIVEEHSPFLGCLPILPSSRDGKQLAAVCRIKALRRLRCCALTVCGAGEGEIGYKPKFLLPVCPPRVFPSCEKLDRQHRGEGAAQSHLVRAETIKAQQSSSH